MPIVAQIEQALFQLAPKDLAFDWDNVGHLEGSPDQEVQRVLVALDVTENVVSEAEKLGCPAHRVPPSADERPLASGGDADSAAQPAIWAVCCGDW